MLRIDFAVGFQSFEMFLTSFQIVVKLHAQHSTQQDE